MKKRSLVLLLASMLALGACDKDGDTPPGGVVNGVSLSETSLDVQLGKRSNDITVTVEGEGDFNKTVKLVTDNDAVAAPSFTEVTSGETFKVYGKAVGTATISVYSVQDETKAASLTVEVKEKQSVIDPEINSFYLDKETKTFTTGDEGYEFTLFVTGKGEYDNSATIEVIETDPEKPCISVDKTVVSSGEKFKVTPSATQDGTAEVKLTSKQDENKTASLRVRVSKPVEPDPVVTESVRLDYASRTISVGDTFTVTAQKIGSGNIAWSFKETGADAYIELVESSNTGATVRGLAPSTSGVTLVAQLGEAKAECKFIIEDVPTDVRDLYVSQNSHLLYEEIYFYAWNDFGGSNAQWPGVKLEDYEENTLNERCYKFQVDILKYPYFKFNNGKADEALQQTGDCEFESLGNNNNVWFDGDGNANFAVFEKDEPSIRFNLTEVTLESQGLPETISFMFRHGTPNKEVVTGAENIQITAFSAGSISIKGLQPGTSTVKIYLEEDESVCDTLVVKVLDSSDIKTIYFTNSLSWSKVFLYKWGDSGNNGWPGEELKNPIKNSGGQDVYLLHIEGIYTHFILSNEEGAQSENLAKNNSHLTNKNNIYLTESTNDEGYIFGFANFEPFVYSVGFGPEGDLEEITLDKNGIKNVVVSAVGEGVTYNVTSGDDFVRLGEKDDSHVIIKWNGVGTATLVVSVGNASATLTINCTNNEAEHENVEFIFSKPGDWSGVYLYTWGAAGGIKTGWPGDEVVDVIGQNKHGQDLYRFVVDASLYDAFIINEGESGKQTTNIVLADIDISLNNIYVGEQVPDTNTFTPGFVKFHAIEPDKFAVTVEESLTKQVEVYSIFEADSITVESLNTSVATVTGIDEGKITITGVAAGTTKVVLSHGSGDDLVKEEIEVTVLEENKKTYYFYNSYDQFTDFSLYLFNSETEESKSPWPGDEFGAPTSLNAEGKECYEVIVDRNAYDAFVLYAKDSTEDYAEKQTFNGYFDEFDAASKDMFAFATGEGAWEFVEEERKWMCHISSGGFHPYAYSVAFNEDNVTVHEGHEEIIGVTANASGVSYVVTSGADKVSIVAAHSNDSQVALEFVAAGDAEVTATLHGETAILHVTASATPLEPDYKTFVFSKPGDWSGVYIYCFGLNETENAPYPGIALSDLDKIGQNKLGEDLYEISIDRNEYTGFIINEGSGLRKTSDILFSSISDYSLNNIYIGSLIDEGEKKYEPGFVQFHEIEPHELEVTLDEGGTHQVTISSIHAADTITVTSSDPAVATVTQIVAGKITISGVAAGSATITLSHGVLPDPVVEETISVTVQEENIVTYYFYNSYDTHDNLRLYLFNATSEKSAFPGDALTGETVKNVSLKECYTVEVDRNLWDSFIIVAYDKTNLHDVQTVDVAFDDYSSNNMFAFGSEWDGNTCSILAGTFAPHEHSYNDITHQCVCGVMDPDAPELVTLHFTDNKMSASEIVVKAWDSSAGSPDYDSGLIHSTYSFINEYGERVYEFQVDKNNNDRIAFLDNLDHSIRTEAIDITSAVDTDAYYCENLVGDVYPVGTWTFSETRTLYVDIGVWGLSDAAEIFIHYWDATNGIAEADAKMEHVDGYVYRITLPVEVHQVVIVRMPYGSESLNWDTKWNQTENLLFQGYDLFTINSWDAGDGGNSSGAWSNKV